MRRGRAFCGSRSPICVCRLSGGPCALWGGQPFSFIFIAVYMRRRLRERRGCSTWMVRTRSRSGGIVPRESGESFFIAASPAPLRATAKLFVKETWNHVLTIHRTLLHWATPSPPPAGTAAPAATTPPHSSVSHTVPALSTDDNPVAARGGAGGAETAAVGAAAQADTAGRRDSGVGTGASADTGDAGRPADCPRGIAGGLCEGGDEACGWPAFVDLAVAPPTPFTSGTGRGHPQADHAPPCRRGDEGGGGGADGRAFGDLWVGFSGGVPSGGVRADILTVVVAAARQRRAVRRPRRAAAPTAPATGGDGNAGNGGGGGVDDVSAARGGRGVAPAVVPSTSGHAAHRRARGVPPLRGRQGRKTFAFPRRRYQHRRAACLVPLLGWRRRVLRDPHDRRHVWRERWRRGERLEGRRCDARAGSVADSDGDSCGGEGFNTAARHAPLLPRRRRIGRDRWRRRAPPTKYRLAAAGGSRRGGRGRAQRRPATLCRATASCLGRRPERRRRRRSTRTPADVWRRRSAPAVPVAARGRRPLQCRRRQ